MSVPGFYLDQMHKKFKHNVLWPPITSCEVGDYGTIDDTTGMFKKKKPFTKLGNITKDFNITFDIKVGPKSSENLQSKSAQIIAPEIQAPVGTIGGAAGIAVRLDVSFQTSKSMIYHGSEVEIVEIDSLRKVQGVLVDCKEWDKNWVLVTQVHRTEGLVVLLSSSNNSKMKLGGSASLTVSDIAKVAAKVTVLSTEGAVAHYITQGQCTPLVQVQKLKWKQKQWKIQSPMASTLAMHSDNTIDGEESGVFELKPIDSDISLIFVDDESIVEN